MNTKALTALLISGGSLLASCNNGKSAKHENKDSTETAATSPSSAKPANFGNADGQDVLQYTLRNANGMEVKFLNYGGIITDIITPDKNGQKGNVVLSYDSLSGYRQKGQPYFGALVGRYANRIANAKFKLDGKEYTLAANDHGNTLHGGLKGFDKVVWATEQAPTDTSVTLSYVSKDGEEGYPGQLTAKVTYTLTSDNALKIYYEAASTKPTPVNLTNHSYFNLSAGKDSTILGHELTLNAGKYTPVNDKLIPTGKQDPVKGTPMDFTTGKKIGADIDKVKGGYDHNFIADGASGELRKVATVYDPTSGRVMEVLTTQPGIQFYTGNFLDGTLTNTRNGQKYVQHAALCLETQHFPDSPNQPSFPSAILKPGETFKETTVYRFSTK
ncbi:aldose epimerase family protein [Chitinophaga sp. 212800010-3]|uniref:aldose epimerase family protein n=1 Tax=unclassified Chitinophaga TaxID=2619133 RepID=UPI002DE9CCFC|nr:Aldose 1-epimerase [Chitinophaga sp. 212800010-3]